MAKKEVLKSEDKVEKKGVVSKNESNGKACAILSYLFIGILWYFADKKLKNNKFAKYHVKQALVLLAISIVYYLLLRVVFSALFAYLLGYIPLVWVVMGLINAANNSEKALPLIGRFASVFTF